MFKLSNKKLINEFNIQTNPYLDIKNKHITDKKVVGGVNATDADIDDNIDADIDADIENEEYLEITSDMTDELQTTVRDNKFIYSGENIINPGVTELKEGTKINLFIYKINNSGLKPFIEVCLYKMSNNQLYFPTYKWSNYKTPYDLRDKLKNTFKHYTDDISYKGYFNNNDTVYLFYCLKDNQYIQEYSNTNLWIWTMIDEIVNKQHVYNLLINNNVYEFMVKHSEFNYLEDIQGNMIEIPTIAYYKADEENKNVIINIGLIGSEYKFYTYKDIISRNSDNTFLIRFILFLGNTFVDLNKSSEYMDTTEDNMWIATHDSYVKTLQLKKVNNTLVSVYPFYIVKHNNQFMPLSFLNNK